MKAKTQSRSCFEYHVNKENTPGKLFKCQTEKTNKFLRNCDSGNGQWLSHEYLDHQFQPSSLEFYIDQVLRIDYIANI